MNLGNILGGASSAVTGYLQDQQERQQQNTREALQSYHIKRQQEQDQLSAELSRRQMQGQEQQQAIQNRLRGFMPSAAPLTTDPLTRIQGAPVGPDESISRDESLGRMEAPPSTTMPPTAVKLPNVDLGAVHQATLDKGRRPSGVPGMDWNPDDSEKGYERRQESLERQRTLESQEDRSRMRLESATHQPIMGSPEWMQAKAYEASLHPDKAQQDHYTSVTITGKDGAQHVARFNTRTGQIEDTGMGAKMQGGGGAGAGGGVAGPAKLTDSQRKLRGFADQATRSYATMQALADKVDPAKVTAAMQFPRATNPFLSPEEQQYVQAFLDFNASVTHQESGARVSAEQMMRDYRRHGVVVGDAPVTRQSKLDAAWQKTMEQQAGGYGGEAPAIAAERRRFLDAVKRGAPYLEAKAVFDAQVAKILGGQ